MYQVICVDDEKFVLEDLKQAIDWEGFGMELAFLTTSPMDALNYMKEHPVDLLLTDISMPQMMGTELILRAKQLHRSVFVLVLSAYNTFDYVRAAMKNGAENYLLKPLDPDELSESISIIATHLDSRRKISENFGPSMLTFRSSFVESWCRATVEDDDLISRASLLGIDLQRDNYTVVLFSVRDDVTNQMSTLFDRLLSLFLNHYICHFYFESPSILIAVLSSQGEFSALRLQGELNHLRPRLTFPFFAAVGTTVDNYADLGSSYRSVHKFQMLRFSPIPFIDCSFLQFPLSSQQLIEQNFLETDVDTYLDEIEQILQGLSPNRRISCQLAVANWALGQVTAALSEKQITGLLSEIVVDGSDSPNILPYLRNLYHKIVLLLGQQEENTSAASQCVRVVLDQVQNCSNKDISLKSLSAQLHINPSYLGVLFKQYTGQYFNDYLNEERLKYAAKLMENDKIRLKDIADMAGFSSQTYFNRQFKKFYSMSPNAYRKGLSGKKEAQ